MHHAWWTVINYFEGIAVPRCIKSSSISKYRYHLPHSVSWNIRVTVYAKCCWSVIRKMESDLSRINWMIRLFQLQLNINTFRWLLNTATRCHFTFNLFVTIVFTLTSEWGSKLVSWSAPSFTCVLSVGQYTTFMFMIGPWRLDTCLTRNHFGWVTPVETWLLLHKTKGGGGEKGDFYVHWSLPDTM